MEEDGYLPEILC
jgi:hypothetical protein